MITIEGARGPDGEFGAIGRVHVRGNPTAVWDFVGAQRARRRRLRAFWSSAPLRRQAPVTIGRVCLHTAPMPRSAAAAQYRPCGAPSCRGAPAEAQGPSCRAARAAPHTRCHGTRSPTRRSPRHGPTPPRGTPHRVTSTPLAPAMPPCSHPTITSGPPHPWPPPSAHEQLMSRCSPPGTRASRPPRWWRTAACSKSCTRRVQAPPRPRGLCRAQRCAAACAHAQSPCPCARRCKHPRPAPVNPRAPRCCSGTSSRCRGTCTSTWTRPRTAARWRSGHA